jgi:hypothetical protein
MKPIAIVLVVFLASLGAAGAAVLATSLSRTSPELARAAPVVSATPAPASASAHGETGQLTAQLEQLGLRLGSLEDEVRRLRDGGAREPALADSEPLPETVPLASPLNVNAAQREVIEQVLADVRASEEAERDERRLQREEDEILARAERIATEIGLSAPDQKALADHLSVAAVKRRELKDRARDDGFDRTTIREDVRALRDWSEQSLVETFGADLARQIQEVDRNSRFGGREGGGGENRDGGRERGPGGGGDGGRGRRGD